ncbi:acyclic terpene utilization AtuA family protein [Amycolatopsis sp. NPDC006125]|uniref:acyclic terpene utilization AtuA family protein n=1 Tax=Amycolatopsis sp. NPDC006125 TaxID=3156730 RepID=UPI0033A61B65
MGNEPVKSVRVLTPSGMLGAGWDHATIERGIALGADVISIDGGSTDSGPHYLGSATAKTTAKAVARDLRSLFTAAADAGIPVIVGSCGTSGTDRGVDWVAGIAAEVMAEEGLDLPVAKIYSEQNPADLKEHLNAGRVHPLPPLGELRAETLESCTHIVGAMGHEPIVAALRAGAQVVLAGRATDTAVAAAYPLMMGMPAGPTWHAAKIVECGGQCTTNPRGEYAFDLRLYGHNAVLDDLEPESGPPREVGVMLLVNAPDQATATAVAKVANPLMLHLPAPGMDYLPSFAFASSPAEVERGAAYEFVLNHVVDCDDPLSLFRIELGENTRA